MNLNQPASFVRKPLQGCSVHLIDIDIVFQGDTLYLFFETKNSITMQGDIGVARSTDNGATWQQLGIALDEDWHLSYPYVFDYNGQVRSEFPIYA